uniref:Secreted protein n=1 Tax=Ditylenchus dipsaci TaxID=166011 RepID=A0A915EEA8_9BILA
MLHVFRLTPEQGGAINSNGKRILAIVWLCRAIKADVRRSRCKCLTVRIFFRTVSMTYYAEVWLRKTIKVRAVSIQCIKSMGLELLEAQIRMGKWTQQYIVSLTLLGIGEQQKTID